jgi:hypothetical protein
MNRLRDEGGEGPVGEKGLELIRRTPGTPAMPDMKRRVWAALEASGHARVAAPRLGLRAFAAAGIVLGLCGTAGAVIARHWIQTKLTPPPAPTPVPVAARSLPPTHALARAAAPAPLPEPETAPASAPTVKARPAKAGPPRAAELHAATAAATAAERTQVLDAMVALRRDHDPARAGRLLDQYLGAHPHGALREEALVLAIEAATARHDAPSARRWAAAYGDAYPSGRFRKFARETLDADTP